MESLLIYRIFCVTCMLVAMMPDVTETALSCVKHTCIHLAVLLPYDPSYEFSVGNVLPAIDNAVAEVNDVMRREHNVTLVVHSGDSECNAIGGPLAAFDFYQRKKVHVFLGPVDEDGLSQVARYATRWHIPVISAGGYGPDLA